MTPSHAKAIAVAVDGLREAGVDPADVVRALYDAETAARMVRAVDGEAETIIQMIDYCSLRRDTQEIYDSGRETIPVRLSRAVFERMRAHGDQLTAAASARRHEVCADCHVHPCNCDVDHSAEPSAT